MDANVRKRGMECATSEATRNQQQRRFHEKVDTQVDTHSSTEDHHSGRSLCLRGWHRDELGFLGERHEEREGMGGKKTGG